jgi:outer membrane receptor protein involved in Fe transport
MRRDAAVLLGAATLLAAHPAFAQRITGSLVGTVRDTSGAVLPGVTVALRGEKIVGVQNGTTNESGFYRFIGLPPGSYELRFERPGFATLRREAVRVSVGATTEIEAELKVSEVAEEVTVVGDTPVVDTQTNQVSANFDKDWVRSAPIARFSFFDLINAAPGVSRSWSGSTISTVFGSGGDENSYQIDGTNLTSPVDGTAVPWPNPDAIEEVEVLSLGAPAEYGDASGAVFNVVIRQGTNQFHGDLNVHLQTDGLTGRNTTDEQDDGFPFHREKYHDGSVQLAGPILKDNLWFFASYQYVRDYKAQARVDPSLYSRDHINRVFGKLNWQIKPGHTLAFGYHDDFGVNYPAPFPNASPSNVGVGRYKNPTPNLMYTGVLSDKTVVEARVSGFFGDFSYGPLEDRPRNEPVFYDLDTSQYSGGLFSWGNSKQPRQGATVKVSHFADEFLGGSHDFRFGVQAFGGGVDDALLAYNDFIFIYTYTGGDGMSRQLAYGYDYQPYSYGGTASGVGAFVDDTFRPSDRLTLNLGLRYDHKRARIPELLVPDQQGNPSGESVPSRSLYTWNVVAPRVGFNFKLTKDGRTVLRAHYGRYYRAIAAGEYGSNIGVSPQVTLAGVYDLVAGIFVDPVASQRSENLGVGANYRNPYTDQFTAGLERQLRPDLALGIHYVHKRGRNLAAWRDVRGVYEDAVYVDDQGEDATGQSFVVKRLVSDPADRFFEQTNPPQMKTDIHAVTAEVTKRMSGGWQAGASYTYLHTRGLMPWNKAGPRDPGYASLVFSDFGQNPNDFVNASGRLPAERPHAVTLQLVAELPFGFMVGANYSYQTGRNWVRQVRVPGLGFPSAAIVQAEERDGRRRLPSLSLLDLRLQKTIKLGGRARVVLLGDLLNAFNEDAPEGLLSRIGTSPDFGVGRSFVLPRRLMLGAKLTF